LTETFKIGKIDIGQGAPFFLIAGPCVIEDEALTLDVAAALKEISGRLAIPIIFKTSY